MSNLFNFVSNNVKGLGSKSKRQNIFQRLKDLIKNKGIIFIQESHSSKEVEETWRDDFGKENEIYFCNGTSNSKGVAIGICGIDHKVTTVFTDKKGRILILEISINNEQYILVNLYNENNEKDQVSLLNELELNLSNFEISHKTNIILAGDLNFYFDKILEAKGGNPQTKKQSIANFLKIKEKFDLTDIWRIRNKKSKKYTFRQNHFSGYLQRRLDYIFISNNIQPQVKSVDIEIAIASDHSPVSMSIGKQKISQKGPGFWKFNSSFLNDNVFISNLTKVIEDTKIEQINSENKQVNWEILKYKIRRFTIKYSKEKATERRRTQLELENRIKQLEQLEHFFDNIEYIEKKKELDDIYNKYTEGARIRSKCTDYELGEKSNKYFLNLEKHRAKMSSISRLIDENENEIIDPTAILAKLKEFYGKLFNNNCETTKQETNIFLNNIELKILNENDKRLCGKILNENELHNSLMGMDSEKSPGNDGLISEFYKQFWDSIKHPFMASIIEARLKGELSSSQRQAIIKLIEKKDRDKTQIKNWRPISLLNVDTKIVSQAFALRLKEVLPRIISSEQTAYVKDRFIGEGGRLISDIMELTDTLNLSGYFVTIDFEKAFDSLNHQFLLEVLNKFGFPDYFLEWISIFLKKQESCVINGGTTTKYFDLKRGARQGDPISAYLFIMALEVLFILIKKNDNIKPLELFKKTFLYSAYADDVTFFLKDLNSIKYLVKDLKIFYNFSDLKPNYDKCEISGCGITKGALGALCGMKTVDLTKDTMKILGIHFSYNKTLMSEKNFSDTISKIEKLLHIWRQRNLTLEGKIIIFKTLAISKIVYIAYLSDVPSGIIETLEKIQNEFLWNNKRAKINHKSLCNKYDKGGLQKVDIQLKIDALQMSWVKRLFDDSNHQWKILPKLCFEKAYGTSEIFYPHFRPSSSQLLQLPAFYKNIAEKWSKCSSSPIDTRNILGQYLWQNEYIQIANKPYTIREFFEAKLLFVNQLFANGRPKTWSQVKREFRLNEHLYFKFIQLLDSIPQTWKSKIAEEAFDFNENMQHHQGVLQCTRLVPIDKLISKEIYNILLRNRDHIPTAQLRYKSKFSNLNEQNWSGIYILPRRITKDPFSRYFQFKILNNILYLNQKLFLFGISQTKECSFCMNSDETIYHIFSECHVSKNLWEEVRLFFNPSINIPSLPTQSALFGFFEEVKFHNILINHILLIFKIYIYRRRDIKSLFFTSLLIEYKRICKMELVIESVLNIRTIYSEKWEPIKHLLE